MRDQPRVDRRTVLKTTGGLAGMATLGSFGAGTVAASDHVRAVRVDQVGYLPEMKKVAVVVMDILGGDDAASDFEVVDPTPMQLSPDSLRIR